MGRITIGKISKIRGIKGEVVVFPMTDNPERFFKLKEVYLSGEGDKLFQIRKVKKLKNKVFLTFEGINSPEASKPLVGNFLEIEKSFLTPLTKDKFYIFDLIGLKVITKQGIEVGEIEDVWLLPANDVFVVRRGKKDYNIPALKKIVKKIDLKKKVMIIDPLPGLLD
jgi:16S rRNA processing protein RimM